MSTLRCGFEDGPFDGQELDVPMEDRRVPEVVHVGDFEVDFPVAQSGPGEYRRRYLLGHGGRRYPVYFWRPEGGQHGPTGDYGDDLGPIQPEDERLYRETGLRPGRETDASD